MYVGTGYFIESRSGKDSVGKTLNNALLQSRFDNDFVQKRVRDVEKERGKLRIVRSGGGLPSVGGGGGGVLLLEREERPSLY